MFASDFYMGFVFCWVVGWLIVCIGGRVYGLVFLGLWLVRLVDFDADFCCFELLVLRLVAVVV